MYDLMWAGWCGTFCIIVRGFVLTMWLRMTVTDFLMFKDVWMTSVCSRPTAAWQGEGWDVRVKIHCGSCICKESLFAFVSVAGLSLSVFPIHLHGSDSNRCTGLQEIRLRDPQRNKHFPQQVSQWLWHLFHKTRNKRKKKNTAKITSITKNQSALWLPSQWLDISKLTLVRD